MYSKQVINPELLNALAHDAKHVLSFATLRKYRDPSDRSRSPIISPVPQQMSSTAQLALFAKSYTSAKQGDDLATDSENTFVTWRKTTKPVARHFNLPNHSNQHMVVCGLSLRQGSTESRKTLEQKIFFKSVLLILTVLTNAFHSTNLFSCFSHYQAPTNNVAPSFCI